VGVAIQSEIAASRIPGSTRIAGEVEKKLHTKITTNPQRSFILDLSDVYVRKK